MKLYTKSYHFLTLKFRIFPLFGLIPPLGLGWIAVFFIFISVTKIFAQETNHKDTIPQRQLFDYLKSKKAREEADTKTAEKPEAHKTFFGIIPAIASNPTSGFIYGLAGNLGRYLGDVDSTRISAVSLVANLTTKNQFFLTSRSNIFTKNDGWILQGDWRFLISNQPTYGLGTNINEDEKSLLKYNLIRIHQTFLKKTAKNLYFGLGVHYDNWYNISDELAEKRIAENNPNLTPYYAYNLLNNFDIKQSTASGISTNAIYDSRDNAINTYKGSYLAFNYRVCAKDLGGSSNYEQIFAEARHFIKLHAEKARILGFWGFMQLITAGKAPYMMLPSVGWDTYGNSGRGFAQGRFRGQEMLYFETEYRHNISKNGLWGFVVYANTVSLSNQFDNIKFAQKFDYGAGAGLRLKLNKASRTNIAFDYAIGSRASSGFYINVQEMF